MDDRRAAELALYFEAIGSTDRRGAGRGDSLGLAAGAQPSHGRAPGPARPTHCACGGQHHFTPAGDIDLEPLFAEPPAAQPAEDDDDYSALNGHLANGHSGHVVDLAARRSRLYQGGAEGVDPVDSWEDRGRSVDSHHPRSLGSASVAFPVWESAVAPDSRMKRCLQAAAPTWPSRLVWGVALILWGAGMIAWALGA